MGLQVDYMAGMRRRRDGEGLETAAYVGAKRADAWSVGNGRKENKYGVEELQSGGR